MILTAPLFLIGLVAIAIPVVVHLFNFRRYKRVYFSNVDRLEQIQSETRRQSTLRQLLILAARILAIVFLVLAFARPVIPNGNSAALVGSNDVSMFIDNSFSMENTDGNGLLLDRAKEKAREIVAAYSPSDRFQLITNDMEGRQFHWLSKEEVLKEIDAVAVSSASVRLADVAARQLDFLHGGNANNRFAYILSDFQSSVAGFSDFPADSSVLFTLVPLEATEINNIYVDSISLDAPVYHEGGSVGVSVILRNEGDDDLEKVPVTLYVNGRQRALAAVDIPARGDAKAEMHFTIGPEAILNCCVMTTDYPVTFDDSFFFTINVYRSINVLAIEGAANNEFLARLYGGDSLVSYSAVGVNNLDYRLLSASDMVLLDEVPTITTGMAQTLQTYVEDGGTLVVVLGDDLDEASYNSTLQLFSAPLLGGVNAGKVSANAVDFDNRLYRNVFSAKSDDMELPTVTGYRRLQPHAAASHEAIITLANGDAYVSATSYGKGRLYLIASPLREAHTDFVRQALFVPTLYNMALYSVHMNAPASFLGQDEPIELIGAYEGGGSSSLRIVSEAVGGHLATDSAAYEEIPDIRRTAGSAVLVLHESLKKAGNYILQTDNYAEEGLSLNYSRLESQMSFLGRNALNQMIKDYNLRNCSVVRNVDKPLDKYLKEQMEGRRLWRWCLALCLLMLLAEILLIKQGSFRPRQNKQGTP